MERSPDGPSVVIAAGGTGGHIFPGLALAAALHRLRPSVDLTFVGTKRGLEQTLIPKAGERLELVSMTRSTGAERFLLPASLGVASFQARRIVRRTRADVAVGMGGYVSIPLIVGARLAGVPSVIHESGAIPGRANKLSARFTQNVALAWESAAPHFPKAVAPRVVGMPLNPDIASFDRDAVRAEARAAFGVADDQFLVMVNGGSQGSVRLNELAVGLAARWKGRDDVHLVVKAGRDRAPDVQAELERAGAASVATCVAFFDRMDHAYAAADLTVCRAGAGTIAELAVVGLPAILVPYPFATEDHQTVNAKVLVDAGGAAAVPDAEATPEVVGPLVEKLVADPAELERRRAGTLSAARPHAADELARWVLELAGA